MLGIRKLALLAAVFLTWLSTLSPPPSLSLSLQIPAKFFVCVSPENREFFFVLVLGRGQS